MEGGLGSKIALVRRTVKEFSEDQMTDRAAALTYYGLLSLFPALIALVSIFGLVADPDTATRKISEIVNELGPSTAADTFAGPIESITSNRGASGVLFVVGILVALWSASGYVGAFMRAANVVYETEEGRPFWKLRPLQVGVTLLMILLLAALLIGLVMTGPVVSAVGDAIGVGGTAQSAWNVAKWPVMLAVAMLMIAVLYYAAPNARLPGFKWVTPGSALAVAAWILASAAFALYVGNFGSYDKTYGALGGLVALLVWMWITNLAILLGLELDAEIERQREIDLGVEGAERELRLEPRDQPS